MDNDTGAILSCHRVQPQKLKLSKKYVQPQNLRYPTTIQELFHREYIYSYRHNEYF